MNNHNTQGSLVFFHVYIQRCSENGACQGRNNIIHFIKLFKSNILDLSLHKIMQSDKK